MIIHESGIIVNQGAVARDELLAGVKEGDWDLSEQLISLEENQSIEVVIVSAGPIARLENVERGEVKVSEVATWIVQDVRTWIKGSMLSTAMLDRVLPSRVGHHAIIFKGGQVKTRNGYMTDVYHVKSHPAGRCDLCVEYKRRATVIDVPAKEMRAAAK